MSTSRTIPPPVAVTAPMTSTPNTSSPATMPASAPSSANTAVARRSTAVKR